ncbi:class I SAM-dependent methyltransferase [Flavobacteriaceae bacterium 14752]|uniref:class I SAM-dependent methyltransferase n=1 Tax=Mesohalobacter salilacus TaxID=2491711 RepID=UPI000F62E6F1|nr:SAM-dependent methyltransferase [Flavobacteriaceae bacterium 14752]
MKSREEINETEKEYWNERKLDRTKIKPLRRHAFHFSYIREKKLLKILTSKFKDQEVLELGSYVWASWIKGHVQPKKLTAINISQAELENGIKHSKNVDFPTEFHLMDANNLTFKDESFDVVFGGAILHHLDVEKTLKHVHRVLKPNGFILFLEPLNMNPIYKIYRKLNPQERTPDEHALVSSDFKILKKYFTFNHFFMDFFSVIFGFISLKIYGDRNYDNWLNRIGSKLDLITSKVNFLHPLFARVVIYGYKK